jgi:phage terminase large subunit
MDDPEKIKSIDKITGIWLEEASEFTLDDFTQLDLRLRGQLAHYKQIILSFNPVNANHWLKKRFFEKPDPQATVVHTTYQDNRFLDEAYIRVLNELKETNFSYYEIYALGKWGSLEGVVYPNWEKVDAMPLDCEVKRWGQDFGFNNPSATVLVGVIGRDLYVQELLYESDLTNAQLISRLKKVPGLTQLQGFLDSAEPDRIQEFRNHGFNVQPAKKDVKAGIDKVRSYNIKVVNGSQNLMNELDLYCWKLGRDKSPLDEPVKQHDHALDALRYAVFLGNQFEMKQLAYKVDGL